MINHPLLNRKRAYQELFGSMLGSARVVMTDLKRFCRFPDAPVVKDMNGHTDAFETGRMIGRQEVFNRIRAMVLIDDQALFNLKDEADE